MMMMMMMMMCVCLAYNINLKCVQCVFKYVLYELNQQFLYHLFYTRIVTDLVLCSKYLLHNCSFPVSAVSSLLALLLLMIQVSRRFYETWFVSIFSDTRMNLSHYAVGFIHYFGSVTAILAESPGFIDDKGLYWLQIKKYIVLKP